MMSQTIHSIPNSLWRVVQLFVMLLLLSCSQAGNPTPAATGLTGGGTGTGGTTGSANTTTALVSGGNALASKFPTMARLQLSIIGAAGTAGIPQQLNLPLGGQAVPLTLPLAVPLTFIFDVFDVNGLYLGTGRSTQTLQANVNPVIPVNVNPVAVGTAYIDPLTGLTGTGPVLSLSVSVMTAASQQPIAGAVVSLGASGTVTAQTNASGIASFTGVPLPQDVHVFRNTGDAVSVLAFQGSSLLVPMPETAPVPANIAVNAPTGPTLAAGELLDVYLTDGMRVQAIGNAVGFTGPNWNSAAIVPMRGSVGMTAMIENGLDPAPRPDRGLLTGSVASGHHIISPLNANIADPFVQPRLTPVGLTISVPPVSGLATISTVVADVFAVQAGGLYQLVSHKDNTLLPANQRSVSIWPVAAGSFVEHVLATDGYSQSEVWQRGATVAALSAPIAYPPVPAVNAASAVSVSWADAALIPPATTPVWSGFKLTLAQGTHQWQLFGLQAGASVSLPTVPLSAVTPLTPGIPATARVAEYVLDPAAGFSTASPELWYLPRMLNERVGSAAFAFTP